jgi:hypothetical protein
MFFTVNITTIYCDKRTGENRGNEGRGSRRRHVSSPWYFLLSLTLSLLVPLIPPSSESLYPQLAHSRKPANHQNGSSNNNSSRDSRCVGASRVPGMFLLSFSFFIYLPMHLQVILCTPVYDPIQLIKLL